MGKRLFRVGTSYLPVSEVEKSVEWYTEKLNAELSYQDSEKAIINMADQSFFLVKTIPGQTANFKDSNGNERFSMTFEVNGLVELENLHTFFIENDVKVGDIEDRGHTGRNFVFYDPDGNMFDVWSELSLAFKERNNIE